MCWAIPALGMTAGQTAMATTAAAGAYSAYGSYQQGKYQEKVAENNAIIQKRMAEDAQDRGQAQESMRRLQSGREISQQRAAMAAGGRDVTTGSALDVLSDSAQMAELDALTIRSNAQREAYGSEVQASNFEAEAGLPRTRGRNQAIGTLLTTGSQVSGQYMNYTQ